MDLRVSGFDLIPNHLTMALYNHAAVWADRPEMWPRGYYTNGHVLLDGKKMSKSTGQSSFIRVHGGFKSFVRMQAISSCSKSPSAFSVLTLLALPLLSPVPSIR